MLFFQVILNKRITGKKTFDLKVSSEPGRQMALRCRVKQRQQRCGEHIQQLLRELMSHAIMHIILTKIIKLVLHNVFSTGWFTQREYWMSDSHIKKLLNIQTRYIENNNNIVIVRIWLYKVLHSPDGKKLLKASETNTTGQKSQNIKVGAAGVLLARG